MSVFRKLAFGIVRQNIVRIVRYSSFESYLSLHRLYPSSNLSLKTPKFQPAISDKFTGYIPVDKLHITYSRSGGPGGQNVNMVNTKVDLRFHVASAEWMPETLRKKFIEEHRRNMTKEGFFIIRSEKTRSQQLNLADALEKLRALMWKLSEPEPTISPETEEKLRRRREKAACIRLSEKRKRSLTKQERSSPVLDL